MQEKKEGSFSPRGGNRYLESAYVPGSTSLENWGDQRIDLVWALQIFPFVGECTSLFKLTQSGIPGPAFMCDPTEANRGCFCFCLDVNFKNLK